MDVLILMYWVSGILLLMFLGSLVYNILYWLKIKNIHNKDYAVMIDKSNRYDLIEIDKSAKSNKKMTYNKGSYYFHTKDSLLNYNGKALYIFSEGKPNPMSIKHNTSEWLDSRSIRATVNNDILKTLVQTSDPLKDSLQMLGNMASICCAILSLVIALKLFDVIK